MNNYINSLEKYIDQISRGNINIYLLILAIIFLISLIFIYAIQLIVHEGGHCLFGLLTGYHFISFRILFLTIIKENGKYHIKKYLIPGSAGQCIMQPPDYIDDKAPFVLYIMGGVIMNFTCFVLTMTLALCSLPITYITRTILLINAFISLGFSLINGIPFKQGKITNDGTNLFFLLQSKQAVKSCFIQMDIIPLMQRGSTYKDFSKYRIKVPEGADLSNGLIAWNKIIECYYYMDLKQWEKALSCINELETFSSIYSKIMLWTIYSEKLYLFIKLKKNNEEIMSLYRQVEKILNRQNIDFNFTRVRMAYNLYRDNSYENKIKVMNDITKKNISYPYLGEARFNTNLLMDMLT